jgi:hypothetical protein
MYVDEIQPTMQQTVAWLNQMGFQTTDSGDGASNEGMGCEISRPHVFMQSQWHTVIHDATLLQMLAKAYWADGVELKVEASYDPGDGIAILSLWGVTDASPLREKRSLREGIDRIRELMGDDLADYDPGALLEELRGKPGHIDGPDADALRGKTAGLAKYSLYFDGLDVDAYLRECRGEE